MRGIGGNCYCDVDGIFREVESSASLLRYIEKDLLL